MHISGLGLRYTYSTGLKGPLRQFWLRGATVTTANYQQELSMDKCSQSLVHCVHALITACISRRYRATAPKLVWKRFFWLRLQKIHDIRIGASAQAPTSHPKILPRPPSLCQTTTALSILIERLRTADENGKKLVTLDRT